MNANEAKRQLCKMRAKFVNDKDTSLAVWIAIRAIDTCIKEGFKVTD